jgi:hypothetical protein
MHEIVIYIILLVGSFFLGFSIGLGFRPLYRQPDNLIIQVCMSIIGIVLILIATVETIAN